jgi:hypothetical protein
MLLTAQELLAAAASEPRANPRAPLRQLLPLHRLSGDRGCGGGGRARRGTLRREDAMKITDDSPPTLSALDRPNSYIGRSVPRPNLARLTRAAPSS